MTEAQAVIDMYSLTEDSEECTSRICALRMIMCYGQYCLYICVSVCIMRTQVGANASI